MKLQNIKTKLLDLDSVGTGFLMAQDGTIVSYDIYADRSVTMCHCRYMSKVRNSNEETESNGEGSIIGG